MDTLLVLLGLGTCEVNGTDGSTAELTARGFLQTMRTWMSGCGLSSVFYLQRTEAEFKIKTD